MISQNSKIYQVVWYWSKEKTLKLKIPFIIGDVAQLVRAPACRAGG